MNGPDAIFETVKHYLPTPARRAARVKFRRLIREFHIHKSTRVYCQKTGVRIDKQLIGLRRTFTGGRNRKVKIYPSRTKGFGRPKNDAVEALVHRLGGFWATHTGSRTTISHRRFDQAPTQWELFAKGVLNKLGYFNVRKYLEIHSKLV